MSDKTINLRPFHCEQAKDGDGFCLVFYANTEGGKRVKVNLHMEFWWVRFLARDLWAVIKRRQSEINEAETALKTPSPE